MDLAAFRSCFPALDRLVWLNCATAPPAPRPVSEALDAARLAWADGSFDWQDWERDADATREPFARLIGADPSTIALLPSLSEAAATVAASLPPGRVVVGADEFRSNLFPWISVEARGCTPVTVPSRADGVLHAEDLAAAIDGSTVLVAVSAVHSATGARPRLDGIAERCREVGARLFVNATQLVGALRFDVSDMRPDFVATHGYKWLLTPRGAAWLHVRPDRLGEVRPLAPSWKTVAEPLADYYGGALEPAPGARRLDASLAWFSWTGALAAIGLIGALDAAEVESRCLALATRFRHEVEAMGFRTLPLQEPSQIVSLAVDDPVAVGAELARRRVKAAVRGGLLRLSFHGFNDEDDLRAGLEALRSVRATG
jgi:selenocysteine lyase/cysteine desulfurase